MLSAAIGALARVPASVSKAAATATGGGGGAGIGVDHPVRASIRASVQISQPSLVLFPTAAAVAFLSQRWDSAE
jgi:hypothetical protein